MKHQVLVIFCTLFYVCESLAACPEPQLKETLRDCPWAEITRTTEGLHPVSYYKKIKSMINLQAPEFLNQLKHDKKIKGLLDLWGLSRNSDESHPNEPIVPRNILSVLATELNHTPFDPSFKYGNAGLNHTYGYLFSNLQTPYGYKRARYVNGEIEKGFGLTEGLFSGAPKTGSLLSNFTYFIASISFGHSPFSSEHIPSELANFAYSKLKFTRLVETTKTDHGTVIIKTDIVPFSNQPDSSSANAALLIYTIDEGEGPRFITSFPVQKKFGEDLFKPELMGETAPIKVKYNGWLKKSVPTTYTGSRKTVEMP